MNTQTLIPYDDAIYNDYVTVGSLEKFIEDAEMIISGDGASWSKDFIKKVGDSLRGATLQFNDGTIAYGYQIRAKLIKTK